MPKHDGIYRRLFSHPILVEDLVRSLLGDDALKDLRTETLEPLPAHYVSDELEQREDDAVWRLRHTGDERGWFYIYLLMEFQSSVDRFMPLRIMAYTSLLYQDLAKREEFDAAGRLPPVVPVVLYNGEAAWTAPLDLEPLIPDVEALDAVKPRFRYLLVDEARHPLDALAPHSPLRAILELERARSPAALQEAVLTAVGTTETLENDDLRRDIETWLRRVLVPARFPGLRGRSLGELLTMETRLERTVRGWTEDWYAQGLERGRSEGLERGRSEGLERGRSEGLERGRSEGLRRGEVRSLCRILERRFGALSPAAFERIEGAEVSTLERWLDRAIDAASVDDVLSS